MITGGFRWAQTGGYGTAPNPVMENVFVPTPVNTFVTNQATDSGTLHLKMHNGVIIKSFIIDIAL